jgi:hypothetical protein
MQISADTAIKLLNARTEGGCRKYGILCANAFISNRLQDEVIIILNKGYMKLSKLDISFHINQIHELGGLSDVLEHVL